MKLSVELGKWRADRPDEWKMDEFIRNAEKLEIENDALSQKLRAAQHEAEALAATVEALRKCGSLLSTNLSYSSDPFADSYRSKWKETLASTPQQHLRDFRAEAGRAGFIAGLEFQRYNAVLQCEIQDRADYYADSIRQEKSYE